MFKTRPCGCKGQRSCLVCEMEHGAWRLPTQTIKDEDKNSCYSFCPQCSNLAWPGWDTYNILQSHPNHAGESIKFPGVKIFLEFIDDAEETELIKHIDEVPWSPSQSGRLKQNYGPKCNFKKKKVKVDSFDGYPMFTKFIQERFKMVDILENFQTVEQCSLEYTPERGASIDPHIDDCWIWGERIPTLNMLSNSILTMVRYNGPSSKYNLHERHNYPSVVKRDCLVKTKDEMIDDYKVINNLNGSLENNCTVSNCESPINIPNIVRIPMPRRSLLIFYGEPRYNWEHAVLREDISERRVCITYRELTPPYLSFGPNHEIGLKILEAGKLFWNHREKYKDDVTLQ